jgi:regulator of extracellular matrix RemA (YlzA/DUF370 family)
MKISMSPLQKPPSRLRIVSADVARAPMKDVISFLKTQADNIDDTAKRCTDPVIVSELQHISSRLRDEATKLETPLAP